MINFIGIQSAFIILLSGFVGLLLAGIEIMFSAYIIKLLSLIGVSEGETGLLQNFLSQVNDPFYILLGFIAITMFRSLLHVMKGYFAVSANELFITRLRLICISSTLFRIGPIQNPSRVFSLISDIFLKSAQTFYGLAHSIPLFVQVVFLMVFLIYLSPGLALIGFVFIGVSGGLVVLLQRNISGIVKPLVGINESLYQSLKRIIDNLLLIRFCKLENYEGDQVAFLLIEYLKKVRKATALSLVSENIPAIIGSVVISVLFFIQLYEQSIGPEEFIAFIYLFVRFVQSLSQLVSFASLSTINLPYFRSAYDYFSGIPNNAIERFEYPLLRGMPRKIIDPYSSRETPSVAVLNTPPTISVKDLCYRHEEGEYLFKDFSLKISAGSQCVIVGPSGSGKSTLLNLLVGELNPQAGEVSINGNEPISFLNCYKDDAAYAGPEPFLFEGGVRENLLYGVTRSVESKEIISVLHQLGLKSWLAQFGGDLSLPLGSQGVATSSGQAQRLSIARAILRKPKLLVMDEVTANLDHESERAVLNLLETLKGHTTVVIVTHSTGMIRNADLKVDLGSVQPNDYERV